MVRNYSSKILRVLNLGLYCASLAAYASNNNDEDRIEFIRRTIQEIDQKIDKDKVKLDAARALDDPVVVALGMSGGRKKYRCKLSCWQKS